MGPSLNPALDINKKPDVHVVVGHDYSNCYKTEVKKVIEKYYYW